MDAGGTAPTAGSLRDAGAVAETRRTRSFLIRILLESLVGLGDSRNPTH